MKTMESTTAAEPVGRRGYGVIAALAVVVLAVIAGGWLLLRNDEQTPADHVQDVAAAMRNDDMDKLTEILGFSNEQQVEYRFIAWQIGWGAQPEFSDIDVAGSGTNTFAGTVTYGDDSFYTQAVNSLTSQPVGTPLTTTVTGFVDDDGEVSISSWPPPDGLTTVEAELRPWVEANRPELVDEMFGNDFSGIHFSRRSGELRLEVLNDFLASR